jgi:hypothetical protein
MKHIFKTSTRTYARIALILTIVNSAIQIIYFIHLFLKN